METFYIFTAIVLLGILPAQILILWLLFKRSISFTTFIAFTGYAAPIVIIVYFVAISGLHHVIWGALVSTAMLIFWLYWLLRKIGFPIKELQKNIDEISKGNFNTKIDEKLLSKKNELGEISRSLEIMKSNIAESVDIADKVSKGLIYSAIEASKKIEHKGDLSKAMDTMIFKLKEIITDINLGSSSITSGANELSLSAQAVSTGASEQAASIEEVSASMEEMAATINQNADNALQTEQIAQKSSGNIAVANKAVTNLLESMQLIAEKISIVTEIAEKTDLLAINAAIEAARAGKAGKGFAVVAHEVRNLAVSSKKASDFITNLTKKTVKEATNSSKLLAEVIPDILKTTQLVQEIAASSMEQRNGANQVNQAIIQLSQVTQVNAASSEELSSGAEVFAQQAQSLKKSISSFKLNNESENMMKEDLLKKIEEMNRFIQENYHEQKTDTIVPESISTNKSLLNKKLIGTRIEMEDDENFEEMK